MKKFVFLVIFSALIGCDDDSSGKLGSQAQFPPTEIRTYDGHYTATSEILEGDCGKPEDVSFTIYKNEVYDEPSDPDPVITAEIESRRVTGMIEFGDGSVTLVDASFTADGTLFGDWESSDGACFGYFEATKTDEI